MKPKAAATQLDRFARLALLALFCTLSACAGSSTPVSQQSAQSGSIALDTPAPAGQSAAGTVWPSRGLPALSALPPSTTLAKHTSYDNVLYANGNAIYSSSPGNIFAGSSVVLPSPADGISWAIYSFNTSGYQPGLLDVGIHAGTNSVAWVGISDYKQTAWDFSGPYSAPAQIDLPSGNYLSSGGQCFVCVAVYGGASAQVNFVMLTYDNLVLPDFSVAGTLTDEHGAPIAGGSLSISPSFETHYADALGQYYFGVAAAGMVTITPDPLNYSFSPPNQDVNVAGHETGVDFSGMRVDISGTIITAEGAGVPGVLVTLDPGGRTTYTGGDGAYQFDGVADGSYTVTPLLATYSFAPPVSGTVNVAGADETGVDFTASGGQPTYYIYGLVQETGSTPVPDVVLVLNPGYRIATTNASGEFYFLTLPNGTYTIEPALGLWSFAPPSRTIVVNNANFTTADFSATPPPPTYPVSGTVQSVNAPFNKVPEVLVKLYKSGESLPFAQTYTDTNGVFTFPAVPDGPYTVKPTKYQYTFFPATHDISVSGAAEDAGFYSAVLGANQATWDNFVVGFVSDWCIQCHRPDAPSGVMPYLRTYTEVKNAAGGSNFDIQGGIMPPGYSIHPLYKQYFQEWVDDGMPEN